MELKETGNTQQLLEEIKHLKAKVLALENEKGGHEVLSDSENLVAKEFKFSAEFYRGLYNTDTSSILLLKAGGEVFDLNGTAQAALQAPREEIVGQKIQAVFAKFGFDTADIEHCLFNEWSQKNVRFVSKGKKINGDEIYVEFTLHKSEYYGKAIIACYGRDITHEKKNEEEIIEKYNELKAVNDAIRKISHDNNVDDILKDSVEIVAGFEFVSAAGVFSIDHASEEASLIYNANLPEPLREKISTIKIKDFELDLNTENAFSFAKEKISKFQNAPLVFIPLKIENKVDYVLVFILKQNYKNAMLMLNMLGVEISSYLTQARLQYKLSDSERKFLTVANHSPSMLRVTDDKNVFSFFSDAWLSFTGKQYEPNKPDAWLDSVHEDDLPLLLAEMHTAISQKKNFELSYRLRRNDGAYRWMLDSGIPNYDDHSNYKGYVTAAVDVTDGQLKQQANNQKQAIKYSEGQLQMALATANILALMLDKSGKVKYCNHLFWEKTSWSEDEIIGKSLFDVVDMPNEALFEFGINNLISSFEGKIKTKHEQEIDIRFNSVVLNDHTGDIASITIVGEDITEKKQVTKALHESNKLLQDLFDSATDLIQIFGEDGKFLFVNKAWRETLGYTDDEVEGLDLSDIIHSGHLNGIRRRFQELKTLGQFTDFKTTFITKKGKKLYVSGSVSCSRQEGKNYLYRAIFSNITEKLKSRKSQQLYYKIAELTSKGGELKKLYQNFYIELNKTIGVDSFLVALRDERTGAVDFPYYSNSIYAPNDGIQGREFAEYAINFDRPMFMYGEVIKTFAEKKGLEIKRIPKVWIGVPLQIGSSNFGMIVLQSFNNRKDYNKRDLELVTFISGQLSNAILRKQDENKIYEQAARMQSIFDSGTHLMWTVNKQMEITTYNRNFALMLQRQYGLEAAPYMSVYDIYAKTDHSYKTVWLDAYAMAFKGESCQREIEFARSDGGGSIWNELFLNPIFSQDHTVEEVSGVAHDVTEKKGAELYLQENEEKFRNIFESFQDIYFRTDLDGVINMISPSVTEFLGDRPEDVIGKPVTDYYLSMGKLQYLINKLYIHGSVKNFESQLTDKDGHIKSIISNFRLIYTQDSRPLAIEGVARDISELKKATEEIKKAKDVAENALEVKKQFLSNMSHEIRTPMNGIIGMIDLLVESSLDEEQRQYISTIKKSSETLLTILNDILDLSKIEAGKMTLREGPIDFYATVEKLFSLFQQQAVAKGVQLLYNIAVEVPRYVMADETRLLQIFSNLTSNAIKFTENGSVQIKVSLKEQSGDVYTIKTEVQDSGIGISQENMELLFKQFSQVDASYTKSYGGTGLGLAISQELCNLMQGEIGVVSTEGKGSTFWFNVKLTLCKAEDVQQRTEDETVKILNAFQHQPYILVVDDNAVNLKVASSILLKAGCIVDTANGGQLAVEKITENRYDLVFMDIQMPVMNGIMTTKEIKRRNLPHCPPIIAMTAYSMQEERDSFLQAGMDDYISKPIKAQVLLGKIQEYTAEKRQKSLEARNAAAQEERETLALSTVTEAASPKTETAALSEESSKEGPDYANIPTVNIDTADQLRKYGGDEILESIYADFIEETENFSEGLKDAGNAGDIKEILSILHTIKGNAATLGVEKVACCAAYIEAGLKKGETGNVIGRLAILQDKFEDFKENFKTILNI